MIIKDFKIMVKPDEDKIVQKILFDNHYGWADNSDNYIASPALCFDDGKLYRWSSPITIEEIKSYKSEIPFLTYNEFIELYGDNNTFSKKQTLDFADYYLNHLNEGFTKEELLTQFIIEDANSSI